MNDFSYVSAPRCSVDDEKAIFPSEEDADVFVKLSGGRLIKQRCTSGNGWHVTDERHETFLIAHHSGR